MMLAAAAFEQAVSVLFLDDGAWQLAAGQQPESAGLEPLAPVLEALPFYDVDAIWVEAESLQERGLSPERLVLPARVLERGRVAAFIAGHELLVAG
jgi:tRNA 2-thiouridine synthesizing protein C